MGRGNQKGGKKHKRGKKEGYETKALRLKEDGQEYAQITACKGNCRFDVKCFDGKDSIAILCGKMRKRVFVNMKDIVLVSIRDFQDDKCDIIDLYDDTLVHQLKSETIFLILLIQEKIMNFVKKLMVELNLLWGS